MNGISALTLTSTTPQANIREPSETGLGSDDFMKLMLAQLKYQNPLEAVDQQTFMDQMSTLANVQQMAALKQTLDQSLAANAASLIGRTVEATPEGEAVQGQVERVVIQNGQAYLLIGDRQVPLASVDSIQ